LVSPDPGAAIAKAFRRALGAGDPLAMGAAYNYN
jgi:hypothetical protein